MAIIRLVGSIASDIARQVSAFTSARHQILADNVANLDTPGFKTRDLSEKDFRATLARAVAKSQRENPTGSRLDLPLPGETPAGGSGQGRSADGLRLVFHDDNNRTVEQLMVDMAKNATMQAMALSFVRTQNNIARVIISENITG